MNELHAFITALMEGNPELTEKLMTPTIQRYLDSLGTQETKPALTDNGAMILRYLQGQSDEKMYKAKDIADGLCISSRSVSGAMRKLTSDGFVNKIGKDPSLYMLTEKGKNYVIEGENE